MFCMDYLQELNLMFVHRRELHISLFEKVKKLIPYRKNVCIEVHKCKIIAG